MNKLSYILLVFWVNIFCICSACKTLSWTNTLDLNLYGTVFQIFIMSIGILKPIANVIQLGFTTVRDYKKFMNEKNSIKSHPGCALIARKTEND